MKTCTACDGSGIRPPDGKDSMGMPRWGHEMLDNRVDKRCPTCKGKGEVEDFDYVIKCNCADIPPTMPTARMDHLMTCPVAKYEQFVSVPEPPPGLMEERYKAAEKKVREENLKKLMDTPQFEKLLMKVLNGLTEDEA